MMPTTFTCRKCGRTGSLKKKLPTGATLRCKGCQTSFSPETAAVPFPATAAAENPGAAASGVLGLPRWLWALIGLAALVFAFVGFLAVSASRKMAEDRRIAAQRALDEVSKQREAAQMRKLFQHAQEDIRSKRIAAGIESLRKVVNTENTPADIRSAAEKVLTEAELATSPDRAAESLKKLSDTEFAAFMASGVLPTSLKLGNPALDAAFHETCLSVKSAEISARAAQAQARDKEQREREQMRQRAEAERVAAEERQRAERVAAEERQRAERKAAIAARRHATPVRFTDVANFPEDCMGKFVKLESVWLNGDFVRNEEARIFAAGVGSADGKFVGGFVYKTKKDLTFVVSEKFVRVLNLLLRADSRYRTNLYCQITKIGSAPVAKIYKVETLTVGGQIQDNLEDREASQ